MALSEETRAKIAASWPDILDAVGAGEIGVTLESAAKALAGVGIRSVQRYARQTPGARQELDSALSDGADALVERLPSLILATPDARRARVLVDTLFRIAAARDPKRYGAKSAMTLDVRTVDLTQIITNAQARLAASRTIEGVVAARCIEQGGTGQEAEFADGGRAGGGGRDSGGSTASGVVNVDLALQKLL